MKSKTEVHTLLMNDARLSSALSSQPHSMLEGTLREYVVSKVGSFERALLQALGRGSCVFVVGLLKNELPRWLSENGYKSDNGELFDPRSEARKEKDVVLHDQGGKIKKRFNTERPFFLWAQTEDGLASDLVFVVVPGEDYIIHFSQLLIRFVVKYLDTRQLGFSGADCLKNLLQIRIIPEKCASLFGDLGLKDVVTRLNNVEKHCVVLGYSEFFFSYFLCNDGSWAVISNDDWKGDGEFRVQVLWNEQRKIQVSFLSMRHTFWGSIAYYLARALFEECGVDEILYGAKLGAMIHPNRVLTSLFVPSGFGQGQEVFDTQNVLSSTAPLGTLKKRHWSIPTILDETKAQIDSLQAKHNFESLDNEIGWLAKAASELKKHLGVVHFATDFIHRYEDNPALHENLNTSTARLDLAPRVQAMKVLQASCLLSYLNGSSMSKTMANNLGLSALDLLGRGDINVPDDITKSVCERLNTEKPESMIAWIYDCHPLPYFVLRERGCGFFIRYVYNMQSLTCAERVSMYDSSMITESRLHFWPVPVKNVQKADTIFVEHGKLDEVEKLLFEGAHILELPAYHLDKSLMSVLSNVEIFHCLGLVSDDAIKSEVGLVKEFVEKLQVSSTEPRLVSRKVDFLEVSVEGFGVFAEKQDYFIGGNGVHLVTGELKNLQSNGFGKTTLSVTALIWCLSGLMEGSLSSYIKKPEHMLHRKTNGEIVDTAWVEIRGTVNGETFSLRRTYKKGKASFAILTIDDIPRSVAVDEIANDLFGFSCKDEVERRGSELEELEADVKDLNMALVEKENVLKAAAFRDFLLGAIFWSRDSKCGFMKEDRSFKSALGILRPNDERRLQLLQFALGKFNAVKGILDVEEIAVKKVKKGIEELRTEDASLKLKKSVSDETSKDMLNPTLQSFTNAESEIKDWLAGVLESGSKLKLEEYFEKLPDLKACAEARSLNVAGRWRQVAIGVLVEEYWKDSFEPQIAKRVDNLETEIKEFRSKLSGLNALKLSNAMNEADLLPIQQRSKLFSEKVASTKVELGFGMKAVAKFKTETKCDSCQQNISEAHKSEMIREWNARIKEFQEKLKTEERQLNDSKEEFTSKRRELIVSVEQRLSERVSSLKILETKVAAYRLQRENKFRAEQVAKTRVLSILVEQERVSSQILARDAELKAKEEGLKQLRAQEKFWTDIRDKCEEGAVLDLRLQEKVLEMFRLRVNYFLRLLTWRPEGSNEVATAKYFSVKMNLEKDLRISQTFHHGSGQNDFEVSKQALSTSEYMRCHLAFFLAYGMIFEEQRGVDISLRVFDECFSGMDSYGIAMVLQTFDYLTRPPVMKSDQGEGDLKKQKSYPAQRSFIVAAISPMTNILFKWNRVYMLTDKAKLMKL